MVSLPCALNLILFLAWITAVMESEGVTGFFRVLPPLLAVVLVVNILRLLVLPARDTGGARTGLRVRMMLGGRRLVFCGLYTMAVQIWVFLHIYIRYKGSSSWGTAMLAANGVLACVGCLALLGAGVLRMICTSRRLGIVRRLVMVCTMWIPVVNLAVLLYACRLVSEEYDHEQEKAALRDLRVDSDLCRTRYPLVMVHGIG